LVVGANVLFIVNVPVVAVDATAATNLIAAQALMDVAVCK
jgi:hypothetical protein